jgi:hypothetical protein
LNPVKITIIRGLWLKEKMEEMNQFRIQYIWKCHSGILCIDILKRKKVFFFFFKKGGQEGSNSSCLGIGTSVRGRIRKVCRRVKNRGEIVCTHI